MIDGQKRLVEATLEAQRAEGEGKLALALLYDSSRNQNLSRLGEEEKSRRFFVRRTTDGSIVETFHYMELELARQGVRSLDGRTLGRSDRQVLDDQLMDMLSRDDRALADAGCTVAIVPKGTVFATTIDECPFPHVIAALACRGLVLLDDAIGFLKDNPHLWHDLLNEALDPYRPFTPRDEDAREKLRDLGDAAIPRVGNVERSLVVFNSSPRIRTVAAVAAAIHATCSVEINRWFECLLMTSAQDERPRRGVSGQPSKYVPVDQDVGVRKGHSVGRFAKQDTFDADALFNKDDSYNVDACRALVVKWQGEIDLFDAAAKAGSPKYIVKWGGKEEIVRRDFTKLTKCKQSVKGERLRGAALMRHFIAFLEGIIADASSGGDSS